MCMCVCVCPKAHVFVFSQHIHGDGFLPALYARAEALLTVLVLAIPRRSQPPSLVGSRATHLRRMARLSSSSPVELLRPCRVSVISL